MCIISCYKCVNIGLLRLRNNFSLQYFISRWAKCLFIADTSIFLTRQFCIQFTRISLRVTYLECLNCMTYAYSQPIRFMKRTEINFTFLYIFVAISERRIGFEAWGVTLYAIIGALSGIISFFCLREHDCITKKETLKPIVVLILLNLII